MTGVIIPPSGWKCAKCDKTENLWLNLTDGMILCGRRNWDGSGGNNHAVEHYKETGYPLAVKLGTITSDLEGAGISNLLLLEKLLCIHFFVTQFKFMLENTLKHNIWGWTVLEAKELAFLHITIYEWHDLVLLTRIYLLFVA